MIHIHDIVQLSDEWFELKKDKMSASHATAIGACAKGLETLCKEIALEMIGLKKDNYTNSDMDRGSEFEASGRMAYELERNVTIQEVGGITNELYPGTWMSPDGLIGEDGGAEIKARNDKKHFQLLIGDRGDLVPKNQIQMSLLISGREWWDFVSFNPNFEKPLFIERHYPDLKYHEKLCTGFASGRKLIKQYVEAYQNYK